MRRVIAIGTVLLSSLLGISIFQNCSQPVEGLTVSSSSSAAEDFAVDSKIDTLSYMSCSDMSTADNSAYFTFRAGAYDKGGMKLTEAFYDEISDMNTEDAIDHFVQGEKHGDLQLQFSIRRSNDMVIFAKQNPPSFNDDYYNIFPTVNTEELAGTLVNLQFGDRVRSLSSIFGDTGKFQSSINFYDNAFLEENVRSEFRKGAILALTYNKQDLHNGETIALSPADFEADPTSSDYGFVYGSGYRLTFQQGIVSNDHPARVVGSVEEINLETRIGTGTNWSCPSALRFKIVRPEDYNALDGDGQRVVQCNRVLDPNVLSTNQEIARRVLRTEDWWIDMNNRCVIPKSGVVGFCYGESLDIEYSGSDCGGDKACAHFVSICTANL